jgi:hypothetical protein
VIQLIVAIAVGLLIGVAAGFTMSNALAGAANGTPSNSSIYQYGNR